MIILDTSAVSALMVREPHAMSRLARLQPGAVVISAPVAAEIRSHSYVGS